jgi:hypothetical protein
MYRVWGNGCHQTCELIGFGLWFLPWSSDLQLEGCRLPRPSPPSWSSRPPGPPGWGAAGPPKPRATAGGLGDDRHTSALARKINSNLFCPPAWCQNWCNRRCKTNPADLEGSRGQVLVVLGGFWKGFRGSGEAKSVFHCGHRPATQTPWRSGRREPRKREREVWGATVPRL